MARRVAPHDTSRTAVRRTPARRTQKKTARARPRLTTLARPAPGRYYRRNAQNVKRISHMRALVSVSDKTGVVELAKALAALGVELVSTGGTARTLSAAGLPVVNVAAVTGFPEMMDGRVKTLHPAIHGGILARRHRPDDLAAVRAQNIQPIDVVVVNLYPFAEAAGNPETSFDALVEEIDIGGPSMVRAAAKNFRDVLIVVDPADYSRVLEELRRPGGPQLGFRFELMR